MLSAFDSIQSPDATKQQISNQIINCTFIKILTNVIVFCDFPKEHSSGC